MVRTLRGLIVVGLCLVAVPALAVVKDWNDGTDNWSNGANWTPAGVPGAGDLVNIVFNDDVARTVTYDYTGSAVTLGSLTIDMTGAGTNTTSLLMAANALSTGGESIGANGRGTFTHSGGTHTVGSANLMIGDSATGNGVYNLSGTGALVSNGDEIVGNHGTGAFNHSGGSNTISGANRVLAVGGGTGTGTYTLTGGSLSAGSDELIATSGIGNFNHSGGTNSVFTSLKLATQPTGVGTYSLSGTGQLHVGSRLVVGEFGTGTFTQTGGSATINGLGDLFIGSTSSALGTYSLSGGTLTSNVPVYVGLDATGNGTQAGGTFAQSGGVHQASMLVIGTSAASTGAYNLSGSGTLLTGSEFIGTSGTGSLTQSGGGHTSTGDINIGYLGGSNGTYSLNGGFANAANVYAGGSSSGAGGTGVMSVSGSSTLLTVPGTIKVYNTPGSVLNLQGNGAISAGGINLGGVPSLFNWSSGTLTITNDVAWDAGAGSASTGSIFGSSLSLSSSRTLKVTGNETIGGNGPFSLTLNSGATHSVTGNITVKPGGSLSSTSTSILTYSSLTQAGGTISGTLRNVGNFTHQSGTLSAFFINNGTVTFGSSLNMSGGLSNEAAMTVNTGQTLTVGGNGVNNLGSFTLNGGTIGSGSVFLNSVGGTLTAHGVITPSVTNHGTMIVDGVLSVGSSSTNDGIIQGAGTLTGFSTLGNSAGGVINSTNPGGTLVLTNLFNNNLGGTMNVGPTSTLSISSSWTNAGVVNLQGAGSRLSGQTVTNNGTIQGFGTIASSLATSNNGVFRASGGELTFTANSFFNSSQSQIQVLAGSTAMFVQGMLNNSGTISLIGGTFDNNNKTLLNQGTINGYGTLRTGGLTNSATRLISVGGGDMDVLGSVVNNGVIAIQSGQSAYFFGQVSGSGSFTGTGTAVFLASLSPGNSPALVSFAGNATLGTSLAMELGGTAVGTGYDKIDVEGQLSIGGALNVSLIGGFVPAAWSSFDLLDWGSLSGTFSSINLPALSLGQWDTSQLYSSGVLSVALAGDFNQDAMVDGADYVVWRKGLGTVYSAADYDLWRAHYGEGISGSGSAINGAAVPEPVASAMLIVAAVGLLVRRGRVAQGAR